jgi:DNA-binding response OmpR family regulator
MANAPTILLVEDDTPIIGILKGTLESEGYKTLSAPNGNLGLKKAFENHPDLILLDIIMPEMSGLAMLKQLRLDSWGKNVKVIVVTNLSNPISEKEAKDLHVLDYIIKSDWSLKEIVNHIKKII